MHIGNYNLNAMLTANWSMDYFYNVIDETIYQTKNWKVIEALGVVRGLYSENKSDYEDFNDATKYLVIKLNDEVGWFPVYEEDSKTPETDSFESEECFVSDCTSCFSKESQESDYFDTNSEYSNTEENQQWRPDWMINDPPKLFPSTLLNQLKAPINLKKKVFCITGMFDSFNREQLCILIQDKNGLISDNMTKTVDFLVVGSKQPGKTKLKLAKKYNTEKISEEGILLLLTQSPFSDFTSELKTKLKGLKLELDTRDTFETVKEEMKSHPLYRKEALRLPPLPQHLFDEMDWNVEWNVLDTPQVVNTIV